MNTVERHTTMVGDLRVHYLAVGQGEPVVLLHGWPQTSREWRHVMAGLSSRYRLIAPDLRGAGDSGKPQTGYDKQTMARDVTGLLDQLGIEKAHVVGHDFGATVGYAFASSFRERALSLAVLEMVLPGFGYEQVMQMTPQGGLWHFSFHLTPDLPEMLIAGKEREYLTYFLQNFIYDPSSISDEDIDAYVRAYSAPGALRATLQYYRTIFEDAEQNRIAAQQKLTIPVLALGGALSLGEMTKVFVGDIAEVVDGGSVARCGHWMPEERPDHLIEVLPVHFAKASAA